MKKELNPCPFCGSSDVKIVHDCIGVSPYRLGLPSGVYCNCCNVETNFIYGSKTFKRSEKEIKDELIAKWNNRV